MECRFSIGQKIVAVLDHHNGYFKRGQEFVVLDLAPVCTTWGVKIKEGSEPKVVVCEHGLPWRFKGEFFNQTFFAPVQEVGDMTFEEALLLVSPIKEIIET